MVLLDLPLGPALTEQQARDIFAQGEEAVVFALLALAKLAAQGNPASDSNSHAAPSGMKPTHLKPSTTGKRKKKPGRKPGHVGTRRPKPPPERVDAHEEHQADCCPDCGGPLNRCAETRQRYIEDIPEDLQPVVTEHVIQRDALDSAVLHADETGWRVNGKTHWLWCFTTPRLTYYMIHRSRGHPALLEFFITEFAGILVSDFWRLQRGGLRLRQTCLVHLLRDLKQVEKYKSTAHDWPAFAKLLRRLLGDAIRLWRLRGELPTETYASRRSG